MIVAVGVVVAVVAGLRSTWSPCGLSMLSTITPVGERGRGTRFATTARWFVAGAVAGGVCLGMLGALATRIPLPDAGLLVAAAAVADVCWAGRRAVGHHRQVNERWLDQYRPWVYGAGFGFQIGSGLATYVTTAGVYLVVVLGAASHQPATVIALGVLFGLTRGLAVHLGRRITDPSSMAATHRALARFEPWSRAAIIAVEMVGAAVLWPAAGLAAAVVALADQVIVKRYTLVVRNSKPSR